MPRLYVMKADTGNYYVSKEPIPDVNYFMDDTKYDFVVEKYGKNLFEPLNLNPGEQCTIILYKNKRKRGK